MDYFPRLRNEEYQLPSLPSVIQIVTERFLSNSSHFKMWLSENLIRHNIPNFHEDMEDRSKRQLIGREAHLKTEQKTLKYVLIKDIIVAYQRFCENQKEKSLKQKEIKECILKDKTLKAYVFSVLPGTRVKVETDFRTLTSGEYLLYHELKSLSQQTFLNKDQNLPELNNSTKFQYRDLKESERDAIFPSPNNQKTGGFSQSSNLFWEKLGFYAK